MGRLVKRVAADFDWPLGETWQGYLNPNPGPAECDACQGSGASPAAQRLADLWSGNAPFTAPSPVTAENAVVQARARRHAGAFWQAEAQRLADLYNSKWCHNLDADDVEALRAADRLPPGRHTPVEVNAWSIEDLLGHDAINRYVVIEAACQRHGYDHACPQCLGEGQVWPSEDARLAHESWQPVEPPAGPCYQVWEDVGQGSPLCPPQATPALAAAYMAAHPWGVDDATSLEAWTASIEAEAVAPSFVWTNGVCVSGVQFYYGR